MMRLTLLALLLLLLSLPAHADVTGKARVVDGDTIWISKTKIRLHGIDAPESKQPCTATGIVKRNFQVLTDRVVH